jgi:hypothetical protein
LLQETRRQYIESKQRRCDELRDGYRCLKVKDALPVSNKALMLYTAEHHPAAAAAVQQSSF